MSHGIHTSYDLGLVALSYLVAVGASYTALDLTGRVAAVSGRPKTAWLLGGAAAMGMGIWSMHFTGMLAFQMDGPMAYEVFTTLASMLVAIVGSVIALFFASRPSLGRLNWQLLAGGCLMGWAIVGMHYTGMAAMRMPAHLSYDPVLWWASVGIAISASLAALGLAFKLRTETERIWSWRRVAAALVMGVAICGMHYTGMAAAIFIPAPPGQGMAALGGPTIQPTSLGAGAIGLGTMLVLAIALLSSYKEGLQNQQDALKDQFLSLLSHELRTPINAITGFTSIVADEAVGPLNERQRGFLKKALGGANVLLSLVNDLLDLSRIQAGQFKLTIHDVDFASAVQEVVSSLELLSEQKRLRIHNEVGDGPIPLKADKQRLQQVLVNLIDNAIKFTPPGGTIWIRGRFDGGAYFCEVQDTGIGIGAQDLPRLFKRFSQVDMSSTRSAGGAGLGLSIVKALVEAHGGTVGVSSEPGRGSTFWFTLPATGTTDVSPPEGIKALGRSAS